MICPYCKKETSSTFRNCQICDADLEEYRSIGNKSLEEAGEKDPDSGFVSDRIWGAIGTMVISIVWILIIVHSGTFNPLGLLGLVVLFFGGLYWFFYGIKRGLKEKILNYSKKKMHDKSNDILPVSKYEFESDIKVRCPKCSFIFYEKQLNGELANDQIKCPQCKKSMSKDLIELI